MSADSLAALYFEPRLMLFLLYHIGFYGINTKHPVADGLAAGYYFACMQPDICSGSDMLQKHIAKRRNKKYNNKDMKNLAYISRKRC